MRADSLYYLREKLRFTNPFFDEVAGNYFYSFVLVCWEAKPAASAPTLQPLDLPRVRVAVAAASGDESASDGAQLLRLRRAYAAANGRRAPVNVSCPPTPPPAIPIVSLLRHPPLGLAPRRPRLPPHCP